MQPQEQAEGPGKSGMAAAGEKADRKAGWYAQGRAAAAAGDDALALECFEKAVEAEPESVAVHLERANAYARRDEPLLAAECYGQALRLDPSSGPTWNNFGNLFLNLNDLDSALSCYRNAVRLMPENALTHYSLGRALNLTGEHREALEHLTRACELDPSHVDSWINAGNAMQNLGHLEKAFACFHQALGLAPQRADIHVNRAMILLNQGHFREGWQEYEYRWETAGFAVYKRRNFGKPQWKGEPLTGKRILLHTEQGFGDAIQFARFIPEVARRAAQVYLEVRAPLKELLEGLVEPGHTLIAGEPLPDFDYECSLISLGRALDVAIDSIPGTPYLRVPRDAAEEARRLVDGATKDRGSLRVGLAWRGNPTHRWNRLRSLTPAQMTALDGVPGIQWFVLQKDATPEEMEVLRGFAPAQLPSRSLEGFAATAAVIQQLDLVLSVDTVTAHLAGALGKPLWLAIPASYDWRWHCHLQNSPWYGSARLYRQQEPGDWTGVLRRMAEDLTAAAAGFRGRRSV